MGLSRVNSSNVGARAGDGIRTHEYQLGGLMPYHLATPAKSSYMQVFTPTSRTSVSFWLWRVIFYHK